MSDSTTGPITEHLFPIPGSGQCRTEFAWNLFINGRRVARSGDYFPTEEAAEGVPPLRASSIRDEMLEGVRRVVDLAGGRAPLRRSILQAPRMARGGLRDGGKAAWLVRPSAP